jgi:hypothetical protein
MDADKMTFVQPENPSGYALRAVAMRQMGRETHFRMGNYEQALADARRCVEKQPGAGKYKCGLLGALTALGRYSEADAGNATPPGVLTYHYIPWLAKYVADGFESWQELALPDRTETGSTARLLRAIHRGYQEFYSKARRLVVNGAAVDYSPDGRKMVCARFDPDQIWGHQTPLARPQKPGSKGIDIIEDRQRGTIRSLVSLGFFPRWSPDGKYIAFVKSPFSFRSAFEQIYIIPAAGGGICPNESIRTGCEVAVPGYNKATARRTARLAGAISSEAATVPDRSNVSWAIFTCRQTHCTVHL